MFALRAGARGVGGDAPSPHDSPHDALLHMNVLDDPRDRPDAPLKDVATEDPSPQEPR